MGEGRERPQPSRAAVCVCVCLRRVCLSVPIGFVRRSPHASLAEASSPLSSAMNFFAALTRRDSFMRTILLRTILRQYEPSSLGCTTVTSPVSSSYSSSACSLPDWSAHSAPSLTLALNTAPAELLDAAVDEALRKTPDAEIKELADETTEFAAQRMVREPGQYGPTTPMMAGKSEAVVERWFESSATAVGAGAAKAAKALLIAPGITGFNRTLVDAGGHTSLMAPAGAPWAQPDW